MGAQADDYVASGPSFLSSWNAGAPGSVETVSRVDTNITDIGASLYTMQDVRKHSHHTYGHRNCPRYTRHELTRPEPVVHLG